ncbi:transcription factor IIIA-like isoform X2 [Pararge aegeria]|uniref:transcription factor IIIA-like isoform X2 n=1 Tax=Pararge aegeria TaxID=116150 RepID=UPI0019D1ECFB|nr:transcription factor IIIA-like isoform X2 [Pararge aegeria]
MDVVGLHRVEPSKKIYSCSFDGCTSVFDRPYRLAQHRLVHANVPFTCQEPKCEKAYTSKSHLDRHIKTAHKESDENLLYCCPKCMKKYVNRQNLKRHIKVSHIDNNKPFCCGLCRMYFKKMHQLRAHMYVHNGVKPFRCPMCERDFVTLYEKKKHMRNHKVYECEHCDMKFTRWTELMQHKRVDHVSPEYICHDCGKVFKERGHIIRHVKKHMPNAPVTIFFCPHDNCLRHYSRNSNLKQHILVKHEGMTFDCSLCGAKLSTKAKLNEHIDRHNRPELPVKVHKTLKTGRKKRKDAGTIRYETAMRLAGIVKQKIEEGISRLYTGAINNREYLEDDDTHHSYQNRDFGNKTQDHLKAIEEKTALPKDVKSDPKKHRNINVELKVETIYSNNSIDFQNKDENTTSKPLSTSHNINEATLSSRPNESENFQGKATINKPVNLIEILNRPSIRIPHHEEIEPSTSSRRMNSIEVQVKVESDSDPTNCNTELDIEPTNCDNERDIEPSYLSNDNIDNEEQTGMTNQPITQIFIKEEHSIDQQSTINRNDHFPANIDNGSSNAASLLQLYWRTIFNYRNV